MKKNIIIVLAISVPVLLGIYLYKKRLKKSRLNTGVRRTRTGNNGNNNNNTANDNARQQIYDLQQGQILRDKFIAGGILKESDLPN